MPHFRKKPVEIAAIHYIVGADHNTAVSFESFQDEGSVDRRLQRDELMRQNASDVQKFLRDGGADFECVNDAVDGPCILINTLEGQMKAAPGDWIIKGVKGEFYPCKPDIFAATYDAVEG